MPVEPGRMWITSDTHFGHDKMHLPEYCNRPENFEERIFKGLSQIPAGEVLVHLGDICIGDDENWHNQYIRPLMCRTVLVKGNHDHKSDSWYLDHGWDFVCDGLYVRKYGFKILLTHIPQLPGSHFDINVHGHLHNKTHRPFKDFEGSQYRLFSQEFNNYQPILLSKLVQKKIDPLYEDKKETGVDALDEARLLEERETEDQVPGHR